ncbi:MAG: glycosyltransferase family 39 protein [Chloroflexi bacterium]|nr:glycosyltransferase family 39 protein [Chloroflexota bacterium]
MLLGNRVMSHDESLHTQFSYQYFIGDGYSHTPLMHGPFLFHITALFYWLFGDSDFVARMPVALFGVILVVMPYFLRKPLGKVGALFTGSSSSSRPTSPTTPATSATTSTSSCGP